MVLSVLTGKQGSKKNYGMYALILFITLSLFLTTTVLANNQTTNGTTYNLTNQSTNLTSNTTTPKNLLDINFSTGLPQILPQPQIFPNNNQSSEENKQNSPSGAESSSQNSAVGKEVLAETNKTSEEQPTREADQQIGEKLQTQTEFGTFTLQTKKNIETFTIDKTLHLTINILEKNALAQNNSLDNSLDEDVLYITAPFSLNSRTRFYINNEPLQPLELPYALSDDKRTARLSIGENLKTILLQQTKIHLEGDITPELKQQNYFSLVLNKENYCKNDLVKITIQPQETNAYLYLTKPKGELELLKTKNFTVTEEGSYQLEASIYDENNNEEDFEKNFYVYPENEKEKCQEQSANKENKTTLVNQTKNSNETLELNKTFEINTTTLENQTINTTLDEDNATKIILETTIQNNYGNKKEQYKIQFELPTSEQQTAQTIRGIEKEIKELEEQTKQRKGLFSTEARTNNTIFTIFSKQLNITQPEELKQQLQTKLQQTKQELEQRNPQGFTAILYPTNISIEQITFSQLYLRNNTIRLGIQDVDPKQLTTTKKFIRAFAIDPTQTNFTTAQVTLTAQGKTLYKCQEWNYNTSTCEGEWEIYKTGLEPGKKYNFTLTPQDPGFAEQATEENEFIISSGSTSQTQTINEVNLSRAFVLCKTRNNQNAGTEPDVFSATCRFNNATSIIAERYQADDPITMTYQVVESENIRVQRGSTTFATTDTTKDVTLTTPINLNKSIILFSQRLNAGATSGTVQFYHIAEFVDNQTIRFTRGTSGSTSQIEWQVIEFTDQTTVQSGTITGWDLETINDERTTLPTSVNTSLSWMVYSYTITNVGLSRTSITGELENETTLHFWKESSSSGANTGTVSWFVVSMPPDLNASVQRGTYSTSATTDYLKDITINSVDRDRSFSYFGHATCTGSGNAYPRPFWTNRLTNNTNLQLERGYYGQNSDIAWEVITLPYYRQGLYWNQTTLNLGSDVVSNGDLNGSANYTATGYNDGIAVTCESGNCSTITKFTATPLHMDNGDKVQVTFTCHNDSAGYFTANYSVTSSQAYEKDYILVSCRFTPDTHVDWETNYYNLTTEYNTGQNTTQLNIYPHGTNTGINISCVSGDCATIYTNWTNNTTLNDHETTPVTIFCNTSNYGQHSAKLSLTSNENPAPDNLDFECNVEDTRPPGTLTNLHNQSQSYSWINWQWSNPSDNDYDHVEIYIDGVFKTNISNTTTIYNLTGLQPNTTYEIETQTVDVHGNKNTTWVNATATTPDNQPPTITLISPQNNSFGKEHWRTLKASAQDPEGSDELCIAFYGSNDTAFTTNNLIYKHCQQSSGEETYNWSQALPQTPEANSEILWHFNNESAYGEDDTTVHNFASSTQNHDRTCTGTACPEVDREGRFYQSRKYDGVDDFFLLDESYFNDAFTTRSFEFWIKPSTTSGIRPIYEEGGSTNGLGVIIRDGELQYATRTSSTQYTINYPYTDTTKWHQVIITYDAGNMSLYLDGTLVNTTDTSSSYTTISSHGNDGGLGAIYGSSAFGTITGYFEGNIDEVHILNKKLTPQEIQNNFFQDKKTYYWKATVEDEFANASTGIYSFTIVDDKNLTVNITQPRPDGNTYNISDTIEIDATVLGNQSPIINISQVKLHIIQPDGNTQEYLMTNQGNGNYTYTYNQTNRIGRYNYTIIAENTAGYTNDTEGGWFYVNHTTSAALFCEESPCIANATLIQSRDNLATPEPNSPNTIDSCTDGSSGTYLQDESIENLTVTDLNGTQFRGGDLVEINITAFCYDSSNDNINFVYANDSQQTTPNWKVIHNINPCPAAGLNTFTYQYTLDDTRTAQAIRAIIGYQGAVGDTCGTDNYADNDDIEINTLKPRENNPPNVTILQPTLHQVFDYGEHVLIQANVTDLNEIEYVQAHINTTNNNWTLNLTDNNLDGIYEGTFTNTNKATNYTITIIAEDEFGNINNTEQTLFEINDSATLTIEAINCTPNPVDEFWRSTCYANITDTNYTITNVKANITLPNGTTLNIPQANISQTGTIYSFNYTNITGRGTQTITWIATNNNNVERSNSDQTLTVQEYASLTTTLNTPPDNYYDYSGTTANVEFNCTATDTKDELKTIQLYITNNTNQSFALNQTTNVNGSTNTTTWTLTLGQGNYTWNCLATNNHGNKQWGTNNRSIRIAHDTTPPTTTLITPTNNTNLQNLGTITFTINASDDLELQNCTLWTNTTATWQANQTINLSGTTNTTTFTITNTTTGQYIWNAKCCDSVNNCAFDAIGGINGNNTLNYTRLHLPLVENIHLNSSLNKNQTTENLTVWYNVTDQDSQDDPNLVGVVDWFINNKTFYILNMPFTRSSNDTWTREYSHNLSGKGNNITFNRTGTSDKPLGSTRFGSYRFTGVDGDGSILTVEDDPSNKFEVGQNFTFMAWAKFYSIDNSFHVILEKGYSSNFLFAIATYNSKFMAAVDTTPRTGSATENDCVGNFDVSQHLGEWHHLVATYDHHNITLYVDGVYDTSCAENTSLNLVHNKWGLGAEYDPNQADNTNWESDADMSEFFVLRKALTAGQVARFYEGNYNTIMYTDTSADETWKACITPNDGTYDGQKTCSNELSVIEYLDEWPPVITLITPTNNSIENETSSPPFTFKVEDEHAQNMTCWLNITDTTTNTSSIKAENNSVNNNTPTNISSTSTFSNGIYLWNIICSDGQNNATSETWTLNVSINDTTPPVVVSVSPTNDTTITNTFTPSFSYNATDNMASQLSCQIELTNTDTATTFFAGQQLATNNTITTQQTNISLDDGNYTWRIVCNDGQNNATSENRTLHINYADTTNPTVTLISEKNNSIEYAGRNVEYAFKVTDDDTRQSANTTCTVYRRYENGTIMSYGTLEDVTLNTTLTLTATENQTAKTQWWVTCTDKAGNVGKSIKWNFNYYQTRWLDDMEPGRDAQDGNWSETYTTNTETYGIEGPIGNIYGGDYVYADSPNSEYEIASTEMHLTTPPLNLSGYQTANLSYYNTYDLLMNGADCQDAMIVEVSTDGTNYNIITPTSASYKTINEASNPRDGDQGYCGQQNWTEDYINLTAYAGEETVYIRWTLATSNADSASGYNLDNAVLHGVFETNPPNVTIIKPTAGDLDVQNNPEEIIVNASDDTGIQSVQAIITWNGTQTETITLNNLGGNTYGANFTNTSWIGNYSIQIIASDLFNTINDSETTWFETEQNKSWHTIYGLFNYSLTLGDANNYNAYTWNITERQGNLYIADADANYSLENLKALNQSGDLTEADNALGLTSPYRIVDYFNENNGYAEKNTSFIVDGNVINGVPIMNSTNTSAFITGILWDSADGGTNYNGTQDLVFVTKINESQTGKYGTYDYEISLPSELQSQTGSNNYVTERWELW